ncbi:MAG: hypothetical protein ACOCYV_02525 [Planctomycetota bacterium]
MTLPADHTAIEAWFDASPSREASGAYDDLKLDPIRRVLAALPSPPRPVTVAGTKGKGSTVRFLEAILLAHGENTVAFTSPHVRDLNERWRIDGQPVDAAQLAPACDTVAATETATGCALTYFERCFACACVLAADRPEAVFLCEVGLGGRLDCANALDTRLAICTHLSRDHVHILGDTLTAIAGEKLAIARPDAPLLITNQSPAGDAAIATHQIRAATVIRVPPLPADWTLAAAGVHQRDNAAAALCAAQRLTSLDPQRARAALARTTLSARCQLLQRHDGRRILVDAAHNDASLATTLDTAATLLRPGWLLLLGLARDKDAPGILAVIAERLPAQRCHRCGYAWPRARGRDGWPEAARAWPWHKDIAAALAALPPQQDLCISGSFYLAGEALALLEPRT